MPQKPYFWKIPGVKMKHMALFDMALLQRFTRAGWSAIRLGLLGVLKMPKLPKFGLKCCLKFPLLRLLCLVGGLFSYSWPESTVIITISVLIGVKFLVGFRFRSRSYGVACVPNLSTNSPIRGGPLKGARSMGLPQFFRMSFFLWFLKAS